MKKTITIILKIIMLILAGGLLAASFIVPRTNLITRGMANFYCENIFPRISYLSNTICNFFFFSITETVITLGIIIVIVLLVLFVVYFVKSIKKRKLPDYLLKVFTAVLLIATFMSCTFQLMHGINYKRDTAARRLGLEVSKRDVEDLYKVQAWAYTEMIIARSQLGEDYNMVSHMMTSFPETVYHANILLNTVNKEFDLGLSYNFVRAKPVMLSHYWSYTNIVGAYDPFLGESNINVDYTSPIDFPLTVCHELIHARGYAKEGDANFIAAIACTMSDRADFRYAGYFEIFSSLCGILDNWSSFNSAEMRKVFLDLEATSIYWDSFKTGKVAEKVAEVSESTNNAFLESNGQEGGTDTYQVDSNLYVEFFYDYVFPEIDG